MSSRSSSKQRARRKARPEVSATEREVRALIDRVQATPPPPPSSKEEEEGEDLDAREQRLDEERVALEQQMEVIKRQRAALHLQRRERELRERVAAGARAEAARRETEAEKRIADLRLELDRRQNCCESHRADLKAKMEHLCREYEETGRQADQLRVDFESACSAIGAEVAQAAALRKKQAEHAIRAQLEQEARALGFKISPRPERQKL